MIQTGLIQNAHNDLVTDASYDFYGLRLATCSLDQRIKVWQLDESTGNWSVEDDWKAHDAAVTRVSWAHPEFGTILASSSFDKTVKIWEQTSYAESEQPLPGQLNGGGASAAVAGGGVGTGTARWTERAVLVDAKSSVRAVEFAPQHFGLKLATISSDNQLRIYECLEQPSLATWQLAEDLDVLSLPSSSPTSSSISHTLTLATPTQTLSTLDGASVSLAAQTLQQQQQQNQAPNRPGLGSREADGGWCISWCKDKYWGEIIAAGCGIDGKIKIIPLSSSRRPATLLTLHTSPPRVGSTNDASKAPPTPIATASPATTATTGATGTTTGSNETESAPYAVTSVSWAPSCGRSYHLIATGSRDGKVRIWRIKPPALGDEVEDEGEMGGAGTGGGGAGGTGGDSGEGKWSGSIVGEFDDHKSAVGRVEWNVTGTVLSSSGNDGRVRLWKATAGNVWRPAGHIGVEQAEEHPPDVEMDENPIAD